MSTGRLAATVTKIFLWYHQQDLSPFLFTGTIAHSHQPLFICPFYWVNASNSANPNAKTNSSSIKKGGDNSPRSAKLCHLREPILPVTFISHEWHLPALFHWQTWVKVHYGIEPTELHPKMLFLTLWTAVLRVNQWAVPFTDHLT